ncbi:uncharacterized protein LOC129794681 [Lutzomyia longipalpis]|uniref:uncharacterized protein LOC129794681 n=1 Tax=Lutzomyia longipalpis TaxID=7200 RepID=UPI002483AA68|nr:uncharacterized protein LOC129794681 [Lutzomyia longipalpis]
MNIKHITITIVIFGLNINFSDGKRSLYDLRMDSVNCSDSGLYGKIDCGVEEISPTVSTIQLNFTSTKDFYPLVRIAFFYRYTTYRSFLLDVTEDFCDFLCDSKPANVINYFWKTLRESSNFAQGCPFQKDNTYYIKDYALDMSEFPPILPTGDYRVDVDLIDRTDKTTRIALIQIYAFIKRKSIAELLWS